jgi:protocatechuate 3,4-dioxygenase alpha subunit
MPTDKPSTITPSQTVGPFYAYCLTPTAYNFPALSSNMLATEDAVGRRITVAGHIYDGDGEPVPDGLVEIWQADGEGRYAGHHPALKNSLFKGFGRTECDANGRFLFETVMPGRVMTRDGTLQAPHLALSIFGKGLNRQLYTRLYFAGEASNESDPVLSSVPPELRPSLIAQRSASNENAYEFVIRLQGKDESVFFEV